MSSAFSAKRPLHVEQLEHRLATDRDDEGALSRLFLVDLDVGLEQALASRFARVLNAPQLLQASTSTTEPEELALGFFAFAADGFLAGALALGFLRHHSVIDGFCTRSSSA